MILHVCHTQTWIFDQSDGSARLLRQREGHSTPPTCVRFYTKGSLGLLTSGMTPQHKLHRVSDTHTHSLSSCVQVWTIP